MTQVDQAESEAIQWLVRLRDGEEVDWEELTNWLEAQPSHREAFDRLSLIDSELMNLVVPPPAKEAGRGKWGIAAVGIGAAIAASLVAIFAMPRSEVYRIETQAGQQRTITLRDGSRAELNGGTLIVLDRKRPRLATLERGEAYFEVVHNPQDPFTVQAGAARIVDVGTAFDVVRTGNATEIGVSEGAVSFQSSSGSVQISRGSRLRVQGSQATLSSVPPTSIGSWREGQLVYVNSSLDALAADIQRTRGLRIQIDPNLSRRRFSGTIEVKGTDLELMKRVAVLTGTDAVRSKDGWALTAPRAAQS